ncbi:MAG: deoxyribonuclease V [Gammaproteobacteria bacterium]|nr:deoxyribonuclease V [Gammaproteobacteria bacterium]NIR97652.1 deoxyribonuclease V [Gammaproteobacteria bacterium]NIT63313.1 deoxyribonuclease V [Gammaproteobacteria bacterium]NIV20231.1 deoxyribonuclease V [Gammaproteobacteria bacterium]NIX10648.1 deoxyribonuclease V [Gammaproteobacteria bacterium]
MKLYHAHPWNLTPKEAVELQRRLSAKVVPEDRLPKRVRFVAGTDVGFEQANTVTRAAVAVLRLPELALHEHALVRRPTCFPYVPGLLSFREAPALLEALARLQTRPQIILCDGQGLAHPRRFGLACHIGVLTGIAAVGVAKTRLVGEHEPVPEARGAWTELVDRGEVVGAVLRTRRGTRPVYVSPGHRVSLTSAVRLTMACTGRYRLPETTRWAHRLASGQPAPGA